MLIILQHKLLHVIVTLSENQARHIAVTCFVVIAATATTVVVCVLAIYEMLITVNIRIILALFA